MDHNKTQSAQTAVKVDAPEVKAINEHTVKRNKAFEVLKELVDKQSDPKYKEAFAVIRPSAYGMVGGGGAGQPSLSSRAVAYIADKKKVHEDQLFKDMHIGRKETAQFIRRELKTAEPKDRKWIAFDMKTGEYTLMGTGEKPPVGWTGFVPVEGSVDLSKAGLK